MAYKELIAEALLQLMKEVPSGVSTHYLKDFDQEDVEDTANKLHLQYPAIRETYQGYNKWTPIEIEK